MRTNTTALLTLLFGAILVSIDGLLAWYVFGVFGIHQSLLVFIAAAWLLKSVLNARAKVA